MHTHRRGIDASSWRVRRDVFGRDKWTLLGQRDPSRTHQSFIPPVKSEATLKYRDKIAFRCAMMNIGPGPIRQGLASFDEMCDLYLMYWTQESEGGDLEKGNYCWSSGLPRVTWTSLGLNNIPKETNPRY
jgi:hypothetical protein